MLLFALTGCAAGPAEAEPAPPAPIQEEAPPAERTVFDGGAAVASITSCDQVEAVFGTYIAGLDPVESNSVDEWGAYCQWETPEGAVDLLEIRSVGVQVSPQEGGEAPPLDLLEQMDGFSRIDDAAIARHGGLAYSLTAEIAVAAVTVTTVWLPGAEVTVTGGKWGEHPALDGPAAVAATVQLLGL